MSKIILGDCLEIMPTLSEQCADSIVTDPPYGLGFMGKDWDHGVPGIHFWQEALRVLKPGGHLVAFGGTRTVHRLAVAIEDAGFEIRDQLQWLYGSGFPKSHNIAKANPDAASWSGWGTALKPACEPIILARKPLSGTVACNVIAHGTGALNIQACRVEASGRPARGEHDERPRDGTASSFDMGSGYATGETDLGRWPANVVHDGSEEVLECFPDVESNGGPAIGTPRTKRNTYGEPSAINTCAPRAPSNGSASRFFYCAKASVADREDGLEGMAKVAAAFWQTGNGASGKPSSIETNRPPRAPRANNHPTVKPTELMRWLCRLVTPPGGTILDPFMGSGSTGRGAVLEAFEFVGIEKDSLYVEIARARIFAAERTARAESEERAARAAQGNLFTKEATQFTE